MACGRIHLGPVVCCRVRGFACDSCGKAMTEQQAAIYWQMHIRVAELAAVCGVTLSSARPTA